MANELPVLAISRTALVETGRKFQKLSDDFKGLMPISGFSAPGFWRCCSERGTGDISFGWSASCILSPLRP